MTIKENNLFKGTIMVLMLIVPFMSQAQGAPPATPIDGGLSILLAAGGVYGLRKLSQNKKK